LYDHVEDSSVSEKSGQHYQFKGRFILTSVKSGLMIIDQQRAHIRILYDKYIDQISRRQGVSQGMLFPDIVQFPLSEVAILQEIMEDLSFLGFELTDLGGGSYAINGVPAGIEGLNPIDLIQNMVHTAMEKGGKVKEEVQSILALTLAKAAAIVPGQVLTNEEMTGLVDGLFAVATPNYTPDGKTVLSVINEDDLEKLFK
jgi:DNA mismatch repair protein MutL